MRAKDILLRHAPDEICAAHNAVAIYISLSEHAERLNKSQFRDCLGSIQRHAFDSFILSLSKLFEPPNKRHPNLSIPTAVENLQRQLGYLDISAQKCAWLVEFVQSEIDSNFSVRSRNDLNEVPGLIIRYFGDRCPQTPPRKTHSLDVIFDALRVLRDKRVAHHEDNDLQGLNTTDMDGVKRLLAFAETVVNVVGYGFFGSSRQTTVSPEKFSPDKSWLWPQMQKVVQILE
jgi:hypothetical protein